VDFKRHHYRKTAANDDNFDANTQRREAAEEALRYTPAEIEPRWRQAEFAG
jgi:hypothetical protein